MAKIDRYTGNLQPFGSNATGTERTVFGDTVQSDTLDGNITADFLLGWEKVAGAKPPKQWFNGAMYTTTQLIAYLHQMGVPEYDAAQEYPINAFANVGGVIYKSLVNSNIGNTPASSPAQWEDILAAAISDVAPNPAVTITGTANALIATPDGTAGALVDGLRIRGRAIADNNTAPRTTLNYNGTGPKTVTDVKAVGQLKTGLMYEFVYNGTTTEWEIDGAVGHGQVWRDETANRVNNVSYKNTSHRPIQAAIEYRIESPGDVAFTTTAFVNGIPVKAQTHWAPGVGYSQKNEITVPAGASYRFQCAASNNSGSIIKWYELK